MAGSFLINTPYERARRELTKPSGTPKAGKRSGWYGNNSWYWRREMEINERRLERARNRATT